MKEILYELFASKKFLAALAGCVATLCAKLGWQVPTDTILAALSPLIAYIVAQGIADHGKGSAQVEAQYKLDLAEKLSPTQTEKPQ